MDSRFSAKFVVDGRELKEVDSQTSLDTLVLNGVGLTSYEHSGNTLELTVTIKTTGEKPWPKCEQLGYHGDSKCGSLIKPGTTCKQDHYHKPQWITSDSGDEICSTCVRLGVEPSRPRDADPGYNHKNSGK